MGKTLTLDDVQRVAQSMEAAELQARRMEKDRSEEINNVGSRARKWSKFKTSQKSKESQKCYRCGRAGHIARDKNCPAVGAVCKKCKKIEHFAVVCKTKSGREDEQTNRARGVKQISVERSYKGLDKVEDDDEYAFSIGTNRKGLLNSSAVVDLVVGGVVVKKVLIDSGASCNIVDKQTWEGLKKQGIQCESRKESRKLYPYGSTKPLETLGVFKSKIQCGCEEIEAEFIVIAGKGRTLLGREAAVQLGV